MGGKIGYESRHGQGAKFYIEFPVVAAITRVPENQEPSLPAKVRVLVCEDDPDTAEIIVRTLEQAGYQAEAVYSAAEARRILRNRHFDVMTVDLTLPDEDGVSLIRSLRNEPSTRSLPVVVLSAMTDEGQSHIYGGFGVVDWMVKPIDNNQLIQSVERALETFHGIRVRILHVEDNLEHHRLLSELAGRLAEVDHASTLVEAHAMLQLEQYGLVILDISLPDGSGWELLPHIERLERPPSVLVFTGNDVTEEMAREVTTVLVKARTGNEELLRTIRVLLRNAVH